MPAKPKLKPHYRKLPTESIALTMVRREVGGLVAIDARVPMDTAQAIAKLIYRRMERDDMVRTPEARRRR